MSKERIHAYKALDNALDQVIISATFLKYNNDTTADAHKKQWGLTTLANLLEKAIEDANEAHDEMETENLTDKCEDLFTLLAECAKIEKKERIGCY